MNASLVSLISAFLAFTVLSTEAEQYLNEDHAKVDYLYQIIKFVDWPNTAKKDRPIHFCAFGKNPLRSALGRMHLRKVDNREVQVSYINQNFEIADCNILLVAQKNASNFISKRSPFITKHQILTIGEGNEFAKNGGIIGFTFIDKKFRIEINLQAAEDANITLNANLIEIASHIYQVENG